MRASRSGFQFYEIPQVKDRESPGTPSGADDAMVPSGCKTPFTHHQTHTAEEV